jgi:hypothetical protein
VILRNNLTAAGVHLRLTTIVAILMKDSEAPGNCPEQFSWCDPPV